MRVILHAGMHKTGTTSFQRWLRSNAAQLRGQGVAVFPLDPRVIASTPKLFDPDGLRLDVAAAERDGAHTAVFSHETLCQLYPRGLARLLDVFGGRDTRYVLTLRHWSTFWPSRWAQNAKRRDAQPFGEYRRALLAEPDGKLDAQIWLPLDRARAAGFSDVRAVPYDSDPHAMLAALARACGCPQPASSVRMPANRSGGALAADRIRMFNSVAARLRGEPQNPMADGQSCSFYDLSKIVADFADKAPEKSAALDRFLESTTERVSTWHPVFENWRTELMRRLDDIEPSKWGAFTGPVDGRVLCAGTKAEDAPLGVLDAIAEHLEIEGVMGR